MFERLVFRTSLSSVINLALYKELDLKCQITSVITLNKNISVKIFSFFRIKLILHYTNLQFNEMLMLFHFKKYAFKKFSDIYFTCSFIF